MLYNNFNYKKADTNYKVVSLEESSIKLLNHY